MNSKRKSGIKRKTLTFLLFLFLFICIFFPGDPYKLKLFLIVPIFLISIRDLFQGFSKKYYIYLYLMSVVFFIVITLLSILNTADILSSFLGGYCTIILLLVVICNENEIDFKKMFLFMLKCLSVFTICIFVLDIFRIININEGFINEFVNKYDMGMIGKASIYAFYYKIFFKSSPLLLILLAYSIKEKNVFYILTSLFSLFISGTRANVFLAILLLILGIIIMLKNNKKTGAIFYLVVFCFISLIFIFFNEIIDVFMQIMSTDAAVKSDAIRIGQIEAFKQEFSNVKVLLFGSGFGSEFFDIGRNAYSMNSEMAYFDLLRKIGLFAFVPFIVFILYPFFNKNISSMLKIGYIMYLLVCFSNPLLFSSTSYLLFVFLYLHIIRANQTSYYTHINEVNSLYIFQS